MWTITAALYFVMTFGLSRLFRALEKSFTSD
jgi:ABC-type amino acid transport system permease subunit